MSPMPNYLQQMQQQMQRQQEMWREQQMKGYWWKKREEEAKRLRNQFERGAIDQDGYRQGLQDLKIPVGTTSPQRSHRFLKRLV